MYPATTAIEHVGAKQAFRRFNRVLKQTIVASATCKHVEFYNNCTAETMSPSHPPGDLCQLAAAVTQTTELLKKTAS